MLILLPIQVGLRMGTNVWENNCYIQMPTALSDPVIRVVGHRSRPNNRLTTMRKKMRSMWAK